MCSNIKVVFLHTIKQSSKVVFVNKWYSSITFPWILRISNEVKTQGLGGKKYCRVKLLVRKSDLCLGEPCSAVLQPALPPPPRWVWKGNGAHGRRGPAAGRHTGTGGQGPRNTSHHLLHHHRSWNWMKDLWKEIHKKLYKINNWLNFQRGKNWRLMWG